MTGLGDRSRFTPDGWHTVTARIVAREARELVGFVKDVFGATGDLQPDAPAVLRIGDSIVMVSEAGAREPAPAFLYVYVADADATHRRAVEAGARSLEEPSDLPYGDRRGMVEDRWGNTWQIATHRSPAPPRAADHPNAIRVRELFDAFAAGDVETIRAVIPEHAVWHFPGARGQLAGTHRGRDAIFAFLLRVRALTGGTFHVELIDVVANDVHAVALFRGRAERDGKTLDNPTCLRMRIVDGQVAEVWEFVWDLFSVDEFWS